MFKVKLLSNMGIISNIILLFALLNEYRDQSKLSVVSTDLLSAKKTTTTKDIKLSSSQPWYVMWYVIKLFYFSFFLVNKLIAQEGPFFLQMRIKHLLKSNCIPQATALSKLCAESKEISNVSSFQQAYITCLCSILPNEEAIKEVGKASNCCCHSYNEFIRF